MTQLHLQLALDFGSVAEIVRLTEMALPYVNTIEIGTPLLIREGISVLAAVREVLNGTQVSLFADSKISDEGAAIATLCFEAGADALSVVDGASTNTLRQVWRVAESHERQVWVDLMYHSNPIVRARTIIPYVHGYVVHRPQTGFPPLLVEGLLGIDRPLRLAGGLTLDLARREMATRRAAKGIPHEGIVVGRAITQAKDVKAALEAFAALCRGDGDADDAAV